MLLIALALGSAIHVVNTSDEPPAVEISVSFLSRNAPMPVGFLTKPTTDKEGRYSLLGQLATSATVDRLVAEHVAEEISRPRALVALGTMATVMSYFGDVAGKKGFGYEAKVDRIAGLYNLDIKVGDPGDNGLAAGSKFHILLAPGETVLIEPKRDICGVPMYVIAEVNAVHQTVEIITEH